MQIERPLFKCSGIHMKKASVEECDRNPKDVLQRQEGSEGLVASQSSQCVGSRLSETPSLNEERVIENTSGHCFCPPCVHTWV